VSRSAPTFVPIVLFALLGCGHAQHVETTPRLEPEPTPPAARPAPPPAVRIALGEAGATVVVDDGDPERCVELAGVRVCGERTLEPVALGALALEDGWVLPSEALAAPDARVELSVTESIEPLGPRGGPPTAYLRAGAHTRRLRDVGWVELPPMDAAGLEDTRFARYQRAAVAIEAWLDAPRRTVLILPEGAEAPGTVIADPDASPTAAVVRAWLVEDPDWWRVGLGDYLAMLVDHRAGELSSDAAYDELMMRYIRHRAAPGESPGSAEGSVAGDVGALVAFCVDVELRTQGTSLTEELKALDGGPFEPEALRAQIADEHPAIAQRHYGRAHRRGVIELDSCLRRGGRKLIAHEVPVVDPARLLRVGALDEDTAQVEQGGRGPLRSGDVIRHVRGRAVRRAWDIVFYLRDLEGRHRFSVSIQRGERTIRTWLRMVSLDDELPTRIRFTAAEDLEADDEGDPFRPPTEDRR
jgi:hypothetical protein